MDLSATVFASGPVFALISSCGLLLFGRGKNAKDLPIEGKTVAEEPSQLTISSDRRLEIMERPGNNAASKKRLIPLDRLEKSKKELRTALLEKELVSAALTRLFEAEAAGEITKDEREILGQKYREELKMLNCKISQIDAFIEVGDLETLREQLLQLVHEKIDAIERRIERTQKAAEPLIKEILSKDSATPMNTVAQSQREKEKPQVPDISDLLVSSKTPTASESLGPEAPTAKSTESMAEDLKKTPISEEHDEPVERLAPTQKKKSQESDGQVEELQKELLEALDRLEKLDVET